LHEGPDSSVQFNQGLAGHGRQLTSPYWIVHQESIELGSKLIEVHCQIGKA